jgi:hypothetical protein
MMATTFPIFGATSRYRTCCPFAGLALNAASLTIEPELSWLRLKTFNEFKQLTATPFLFSLLTATRSRRYVSCLTSILTDSAPEFLPELADFHAILAEIRNCPGRDAEDPLKVKGKMAFVRSVHLPGCSAAARFSFASSTPH